MDNLSPEHCYTDTFFMERLDSLGEFLVGSLISPDKKLTGTNEDTPLVQQISPESAVIAVADGAGGHALGHEASTLAIQCLKEALKNTEINSAQLREPIMNALENCNQQLLERGQGSATTLAVVEIQGDIIRPYHVGDSSVLLVGQRGVKKLQTIAHSPIGLGIEAGLLHADAALSHEDRHWVLNILGMQDMRIEVGSSMRMAPYDTLLLCSDGLTDNLPLDAIIDIIRTGPLDLAARQLFKDAHNAMEATDGHPDDLTVALFRPRYSRS